MRAQIRLLLQKQFAQISLPFQQDIFDYLATKNHFFNVKDNKSNWSKACQRYMNGDYGIEIAGGS